jgi:DNA replication protein DnaC
LKKYRAASCLRRDRALRFYVVTTVTPEGFSVKELIKTEKQDLLILDDFGIHSFDTVNRTCLMEIIEVSHGKHSTIIASQLPVRQWYDLIGEKTVADSILDRLVHNAQRIELKGESLRRKWTEKDSDNDD